MKSFVVLHEYGANSHYSALEKVSEEVSYYEVHFLKQFFSGVKNRSTETVLKSFENCLFLLFCFLFPRKLRDVNVILGMAPVNFRLIFIKRIVSKANVTYHSSWTKWNQENWPHKYRFLPTSFLEQFWRKFLVSHVDQFANVTSSVSTSRGEFLAKHDITEFTCYHSFNESVFYPVDNRTKLYKKIIFSGRLVPEKGLLELFEYILQTDYFTLTVVGKGPLREVVRDFSNKSNGKIEYLGFISDKNQLADIYRSHDIIILPSKKTDTWQELFGISMIEGMACGLIPIIHRHSGPLEVISFSDKINAINSDKFSDSLDEFINISLEDKGELRDESIRVSKKFSTNSIGKRWMSI